MLEIDNTKLEINKQKINLFIKDTLKKLQSKETKKEVEFKVIFDGINKEEIEYIHKELQKKILKELKGKVIFNGTIEDTRYYDTKNKDASILNENNISMVRVRSQKAKYGRKKENIYTVKQRIGNSTEPGYEENEYEDNKIKKDFGENILEEEFGLQKIKISRKKRKEFSFEIEVDGKKEEVKVAFDEYLPKQDGDSDIFENNSKIKPFFEVEAKSQKIANNGFEELKRIYPELENANFVIVGPKKLNKQLERDELIKKLGELKTHGLKGKIANSIIDLLENQTVYKTYTEFFENIENDKDYVYNTRLKEDFKKLLEYELNKQIKNQIFERFFHRIITNNNSKNNPRKKFFDKFEREYSGYIKSFLNIIALEFQEKIKNNEPGTDNSRILKDLILEKLDIFLKSLFLFNDSLTKEELEEVLKEDSDKIEHEFNLFTENINKIYCEEDIGNIPDIWGDYDGEDNKRVLNSLATSYSRAYASVAQKGEEIGNKEIIEAKQESIEKEQFAFLSRQFSHWLNSPNRELSTFDTIKNLLKEDFYHIFLLTKKGFAFAELYSEGCEFNQDFINKVAEKYKNNLFNKENFQVQDKGPELFREFVENLFGDSEKVSGKIIDDFKTYNKNHNKNILKEYNEIDNIYRFTEKDISFDFWQKLRIEPRIYLFLNKVLDINNKGFSIKNNFINGKKNLKETFISYEFNKSFNGEKYTREFFDFLKKNNITENSKKVKLFKQKKYTDDYKEQFNKYKVLVNKQFKDLEKFINKKNFNKLDEIYKLVRNNINSFQLLVSWFQFLIKSNKQGKKVEDLSLHSESFAEKVLTKIPDDILQDENLEFITSTSSAYNTSVTDNKRIIELHDRIGNDKSIDVTDNFYFEKGGNKYLMKDFTNLYLPKNKNEEYGYNKMFLLNGIKITRKLLNGDKVNKEEEYYKILEEINFPVGDSKSLKKLSEFQKFILKYILSVSDELSIKSSDKTNDFAQEIYNNIEYEKIYDHNVAEPKNYYRIVEKIVKKYGGDVEQLADGTRATVFGDNLEDLGDKITDLVKFAKNNGEIKSIRFEDKIGNLFKKAKRPNGYRDATLAISNVDGTTVEIQFHLKQFYDIKTGDLQVDKNKLLNLDGEKGFNIENFDIGKRLKSEEIGFTKEEKNTLIEYCITTNTKIPQSFANLFDIENEEIIDNSLKFNADYTYNLERTLGLLDSGINDKLKILDRILFDIAGGEVAAIELERIMSLYETRT